MRIQGAVNGQWSMMLLFDAEAQARSQLTGQDEPCVYVYPIDLLVFWYRLLRGTVYVFRDD